MLEYLPVIISAILIFGALIWWLTALGSVSKSSTAVHKVDAPAVSPAPAPTVEKSATPDQIAVAPLIPDVKPVARRAAPRPPVAKANVAAPAQPLTAAADNLEMLKGVGPKLSNLLKSLGVTSFQQIANWNESDITEIDSKLGNFAGRITRDNWVDQANLLVSGDVAGFEKKYGALGSDVRKG